MSTTEPGPRGRVLVGGVVGLLAGVAILGPALRRGYVWSYDMVFVPDLPLSDRTLGTDGSVPRAVPTDAVVALLGRLLPGDVLQAGLLLTVFVVVGAGLGRLCRTRPGTAAAALAACWNPYVVERLVIGHWSFLLGYATLPWIAHAAREVARGDRRRLLTLLGWLAAASIAGSTSALIATMTAALVLVSSRRPSASLVRPLLAVVGSFLVLSAAWIVPALTRAGGVPADASGVSAFAARSDSDYGTVLSLVTLGGIWHEPSWQASRGSVVTVGLALLVAVAVVVGLTRWRLWDGVRPLAVAGGVGLLVAGLASLPGGERVAEWIVTDVPGGGIIRDSQKFVAPLAVFWAVAAGRLVDEMVARGPAPRWPRPVGPIVAAALALVPVAVLPDAPASAGGRLQAVDIPGSFLAARDRLDRAAPGGVAVFPWALYRRFDWNRDRVSLDPWNRLLDRRVLVNDDLGLASQVVRGEDDDAAAVGAELRRGGDELRPTLTGVGVRWAVLLADQPGADEARRLLVADDAVLDATLGAVEIYDLGPADAQPAASSPWPLVTSVLAAVVLITAGIVTSARRRRRNVA
jgi:hypothetical protein